MKTNQIYLSISPFSSVYLQVPECFYQRHAETNCKNIDYAVSVPNELITEVMGKDTNTCGT